MDKCEICAETKITKKLCKSITRETELLGLEHSDLGDLKHTMTRGGKDFMGSLLMTTLDSINFIY